jgi:hypothetical protein
MSEVAVSAVHRFALQGDTAANQELLHLIDHSLDVGGISVTQTAAPQLLRWWLEDAVAHDSAAVSLYVAVLNRHFCLRVVLDRLAQPVDRRPCGLEELQQLYYAAARQTTQEAAHKQLTQCLACLLIVQEDHLAERLRILICGGTNDGPSDGDNGRQAAAAAGASAASAEDCRLALHVFIAAVDLLVDRRVPIGPIRRATQRRQLQENLSIVLQSPTLTSAEDMPLLINVTDTAVRFLLEAMYGEPQEVAATFWAALPASPVWRYSVGYLSSVTMPCPTAVLDFVCNVLRCLTLMDAAAESLLLDALPAVLRPISTPTDTVDWEAMSRVLAAALEASTEAIITEQSPDTSLFRLFSSAAERLVQVLHAPAAPASAINHVCEGISALTQVLQPTPIPAMEPTDDPDDFREVVDCMTAANATKHAALEQVQPFLATCQTALASRLVQSGFTAAAWRTIAAYVTHRLMDAEVEDYHIAHEELELALYTTYERLSRLLGPLPAQALHSIAPEPGQQLVLATVTAELALQWLQAVETSALLPQAALLPCTVARYVVRPHTSRVTWPADASLAVLDRLLQAASLHETTVVDDVSWCQREGGGGADTKASVLAVTEAAVKVAVAVQGAGFDVAQLRQRCAPLVSLLWQCVVNETSSSVAVKACRTAAQQLSTLLLRGLAALPDSAVEALRTRDPYTQTLLFASGGVTNAKMDTLLALTHTLNCLAQLVEEGADVDEESAEKHVLDRLVVRVRQHVESGEWPAEEVAAALCTWHTRCPSLVLCFLKLAAAVSAPLQPSVMVEGLTRFFSLPEGSDVSTASLVAMLSAEFVRPVAATAPTAAAFYPLLQWLLQPHPAFTVADGGRRVRVLATSGRLLFEAGHVALPALLEALLLCVTRWREFTAATALSGPATEDASDGDDGGAADEEDDAEVERNVLEELAVWSRCAAAMPELPVGAPGWVASLQLAQDDYERIEVLKSM